MEDIPAPNLEIEGVENSDVEENTGEEEAESLEERKGDDSGGEETEGEVEGGEEDGEDEEEGDGEITSDAKLWATLVHLSAILGLLMLKTGSSQPVVCLIGPLFIWLFKREDHEFVDDQGKEAVNFQVVVTVIGMIFWVVPGVGPYLMKLLLLADVGLAIFAATQANQGKRFRYPWLPDALRMLK